MSGTPEERVAANVAKIMADYGDSLKKAAQAQAREEAKQARENKRERKHDTRRKIILGGLLLAEIREGRPQASMLLELVNRQLTTLRDRAIVRAAIPIDEFPPKRE